MDIYGNYQGINRPDIQFTLREGRYVLPNGAVIEVPAGQRRRFYIELDFMPPERGPGHLRRIITNDPQGLVILETTGRRGVLDSLVIK